MGLFITFEGIEGCGKSTQSKALKRRLSRHGFPALLVKEPGTTAVGRVVRRLLKHRLEVDLDISTEVLLFEVARAQLVAEIIRPALGKDEIVICDRYGESTLAYQGYGRGFDLEVIRTINKMATGGIKPDLIFLLDFEPAEGLKRKGEASASDRFEREEISFHRRVREGYLEMAYADPQRWLLIDGALPKRRISELIWEKIQVVLGESNY
ncbi:MAG: dTMP kinase [Dehalococcoidia bacterium]